MNNEKKIKKFVYIKRHAPFEVAAICRHPGRAGEK